MTEAWARWLVWCSWFTDRFDDRADWRSLAWWIHDHLDYSEPVFYPKLWAFNIGLRQKPKRTIKCHIAPLGHIAALGQCADEGHAEWYRDFPAFAFGGEGDA